MDLLYKMLIRCFYIVSIVSVIINFGGCQHGTAPIEQISENSRLNFIEPVSVISAELHKPITANKLISRKYGGTLKLNFDGSEYRNKNMQDMSATLTLQLYPYAVNKRVRISLTMKRTSIYGDIAMEYAPHGLILNKPAILNIRTKNFNLSRIPRDKIDRIALYYVNQENGNWEKMYSEKIFIDIDRGIIRVVNAELPHFSRYAIAYSD